MVDIAPFAGLLFNQKKTGPADGWGKMVIGYFGLAYAAGRGGFPGPELAGCRRPAEACEGRHH